MITSHRQTDQNTNNQRQQMEPTTKTITMKPEIGDKNFPIWLLGDSNPKKWQDILVTPLDPRHPARHSIWTPVLEVIQDRVFRKSRSRVDTSSIYIRNAIEQPENKPPENSTTWDSSLEKGIEDFHQTLDHYRPALIFSFGAFSFEFMRRSLQETPTHHYRYWDTNNLGIEFRQRLECFDPDTVNSLPLLHTSISRGRFYESHNYFSQQVGGNYFEYVGNQIADKLLAYSQQLKIWIE
jgi:hypothetical protein